MVDATDALAACLICELISFGNRIVIRENGVVFEFYLPADRTPRTFFKWLASALPDAINRNVQVFAPANPCIET
jgi:hypothetical protein